MSKEFEVMDEVINDDVNIIEMEPEESESGKVSVGLIVGGIVVAGALGALVYSKIKAKKNSKPKKRKKLMWVEVEDNNDQVEDEFDNDDNTVEAEEE